MTELLDLSRAVLEEAAKTRGGEPRPQQDQMVQAICEALESDENVAVQADTGVGKSIAYLAPTLAKLTFGESDPVLVATATLALQRQILTADAVAVVDAIAKLTGHRFQTAVLKGWSNYLCRYRLDGDASGLDSGEEDVLLAAPARPGSAEAKIWNEVREWAEETDTGDRDDLTVSVPGHLWSKMSVSRLECTGKECPLFKGCFPVLARELAFESDLVVTNHALLSIAATSNPDVMPEPSTLIVDEAHALPDSVRRQATVQLGERVVRSAARAVSAVSKLTASRLEDIAGNLDDALYELRDGLMETRPEPLSAVMAELGETSRQALRQVSEAPTSVAVQAAKARLDGLIEAADVWTNASEESITWKTGYDEDNSLLHIAPLRVTGKIARGILDRAPTVLASATLELGGSFAPMETRLGLGLSARSYEFVDVGGPFDPGRQGILFVPGDLPAPGRDGISEEAIDLFIDLAQAAEGGTLGLFTSRRAAERVAEALRDRTEFTVLEQGQDSVSALVRQFRSDRDSCLVGSLGLWQGVDVRGDSCRMVVMDRIPFPRPDDPVSQALARDAERSRRSGFFEASLVPAGLLMAQGAGRLLRSAEDRGVVAVLDSRLLTRSYGKFLIDSMPPLWRSGDPDEVLAALRRLSSEHR